MFRLLFYCIAFFMGWALSAFISPPDFLSKRVEQAKAAGKDFFQEQGKEIKSAVRDEVRKGAKKLEKSLK